MPKFSFEKELSALALKRLDWQATEVDPLSFLRIYSL